MFLVYVNDKEYTAYDDDTVLSLCERNSIKIPTLCYLKDLNNIGACRMCMVEIDGRDKLFAACKTYLKEGMSVRTESEKITVYRKEMLKLLIANHEMKCEACVKSGDCGLMSLCMEYDIWESDYRGNAKINNIMSLQESNPYIVYDHTKCIHCLRCVSVCNKGAVNGALKTARSANMHVLEAPFGEGWRQSGCETCGNCANVCPTGAISTKRRLKYKMSETKKVLTTCPYCATGCQLYLPVKEGKIVDVLPADGPANRGLLCIKGKSASFGFVTSNDRLKNPLIKDKATGRFKEVGWDEAIGYTAGKFMELKEKYGGDSLAGFACSRASNEDVYMFQKMVRTCFGSNNTDNCARVCHSATVTGLAKTLGSGAMTNPIYDITHDVDAILLIGSNPEEAHPVVGMQIRQAVKRGCKLIVVDPRDIGLTKTADIHLKLKPGTNIAFANGMMNIIINEKLYDEVYITEFTEDFDKLKETVKEYTPEKVSEICHIDKDMLIEAARIYAKAEKAPIIYCLGVTEHTTGTEGVMCMSNLAAICGKIGKSGCGVNPLRGQNNVQGACDMGAMATDYPGYQKVDNPEAREKFEKAWGVKLNPNPGIKATKIFDAALEGKIKGLYVCGEDPLVSEPNSSHVKKGIESLEFLVVQDLFLTETAKYADVVLPAVSFAEKEGTVTNTERRVQRIRKAVECVGNARSDSDIVIDIMNACGYSQKKLTPAQIMEEIASLNPGYGGISYERLDNGESLQWPCPTKDHPGTDIMHKGKPTRGKVLLYPAKYRPSKELPDEEYPILLSTGRILYHYNAASMTAREEGIMEISGNGFIELNEKDAKDLGINNNDKVRVKSRRGSICAIAKVGKKVSEKEAWMPFHFKDSLLNEITNNVFDEMAEIPEYKVCAIKVEKYEL